MDKLLTVEEVAKLLNKPTSWVRRAAKDARLPAYKIGLHYRFDPTTLEVWVLEQQVKPPKPK